MNKYIVIYRGWENIPDVSIVEAKSARAACDAVIGNQPQPIHGDITALPIDELELPWYWNIVS